MSFFSSWDDWIKRNASWTGMSNIGKEALIKADPTPNNWILNSAFPWYQRNVIEPGAAHITKPWQHIFSNESTLQKTEGVLSSITGADLRRSATESLTKRNLKPLQEYHQGTVDKYRAWNAPSWNFGNNRYAGWLPVNSLGLKGAAEIVADPLTWVGAGTVTGGAEKLFQTSSEAAAKRGALGTAERLGSAASKAGKVTNVVKAMESHPVASVMHGPQNVDRFMAEQAARKAITGTGTMQGIPEGLEVRLSNAAEGADIPNTVVQNTDAVTDTIGKGGKEALQGTTERLSANRLTPRAWSLLDRGKRATIAHKAGLPDPFQVAEKEWGELGAAARTLEERGVLPKEWAPKEQPGRVNVKMGDVPEYKPTFTEVKATGPLPEMTGQALDDKLLSVMKDRKVILDEQDAARHLERQRRVSAAQRAGEGKTGIERQIAEKTELKGEMPRADIDPPGPMFSEAERGELYRRIDNTYKTAQTLYKRVNAKDVLTDLLDNGVLPKNYGMKLFRDVYGDDIVQMLYKKALESQWKKANLLGKAGIIGRGLAADVRIMETIGDMSATLRQGIINTVSHPVQSSKGMMKAIESLGDKRVSQKVVESFSEHPSAAILDFAEKQNIHSPFVSLEGALTKEEELFSQGLLTEMLPGVKQVKHLSERHYSTFLNTQRHDLYYGMVQSWEKMYPDIADAIKKTGDLDAEVFYKDAAATTRTAKALKQLDEIGDWTNITTGRGNLPKFLEKHLDTINVIMYASKLMASRLEYVPKGLVYSITNPVVRKEFARELLSLTTFSIGVLAAAKACGAKVEMDPRSTDFGKVRVGNTRVEFMGGFQPYIRYTAQLITGQSKTVTGIKKAGRGDTLARFLRSKESPVAGLVHDIWSGETFVGEPMDLSKQTVARTAYQKLVPLFVQDVEEAVDQEGAMGAAYAAPGFFGAGVTSYAAKPAVTEANTPIGRVTPQQRIESMAWAAYPYYKKINDQIILVGESDPAAAKRLLAQYPQLVAIRKQIALRKKQLKLMYPAGVGGK